MILSFNKYGLICEWAYMRVGLSACGLTHGRKKMLVKSVGLYLDELIRRWAYMQVGLSTGFYGI